MSGKFHMQINIDVHVCMCPGQFACACVCFFLIVTSLMREDLHLRFQLESFLVRLWDESFQEDVQSHLEPKGNILGYNGNILNQIEVFPDLKIKFKAKDKLMDQRNYNWTYQLKELLIRGQEENTQKETINLTGCIFYILSI